MVKGIGVDIVKVATVQGYMEHSDAFVKRTFTEKEIELAKKAYSKPEYFSSRFAVKEAVFKAVAQHTSKKAFDFRKVETLNAEDGHPFININESLKPLLEEAGIQELQVSISTEEEYVIAFVVAQY